MGLKKTLSLMSTPRVADEKKRKERNNRSKI